MTADVENTPVEGVSDADKKAKERGVWGSQVEFILSCVGFSVGLGNIWRFPYLAYRNGGGAFLIPYAIFLLLCGVPLYFLELSFGQFGSQGPITIWRCCPLFEGIGWGMVMVSALVSIYYNVIIGWVIYYFFASLNTQVPWEKCGNAWNSLQCQEYPRIDLTDPNARFNTTPAPCVDVNVSGTVQCLPARSPATEFWENNVLGISSGIEDSGELRWQITLPLALAWLVVFFCLIKGIKSSGKVVYVTAIFPYVVLVILLIRGVTLPGAIDGILFYITPNFDRLRDSRVWLDASTQIFYSLGIAFGSLEVMASFNRFKNNCFRDAIMVSCINCGTSVFGGFVIFSVIGFMSAATGVTVAEAATSGPGLAFVAYPTGLAMMPVAPLWSVLFFLMLFTLGLDSQFAMMETVISALCDKFEILGRNKLRVTLGLCIFFFLLALPMCTRGGMYWFNLMDWYSGTFSLMVISFVECVVISWVYGYNNLAADIEMMIGFRPQLFWKICWMFITPVMILFVLIFSSVEYVPVYYSAYTYPAWAETVGFLMVAAAAGMIPLFMLIVYLRETDWKETLKRVVRPDERWGPALSENRTGRYAPKTMVSNGVGTDNMAFDGQTKGFDGQDMMY